MTTSLAYDRIGHTPPLEFLQIPLKDWLAYAYAATYPFFMFSIVFSRDSLPFWIVVAITCVALVDIAFRHGKVWFDASMTPLLLLVGVYLLSTLTLIVTDADQQWLGRSQVARAIAMDLRLINVAVSFFAFVNVLADAPRRVLMNILRIQLWGGFIVAGYGAAQYFAYAVTGTAVLPIIPPTNEAYSGRSVFMLVGGKSVFRASSVFSEPAYFAFFLVPLVAKSLIVWLEKAPVLGKRSLIIVSTTLGLALATNFSMTGIGSTMLVVLLVWLTSLGRSQAIVKFSVVLLLVATLLIVFTPLGSMVSARFERILALSDPSTLDRLFRAATGFISFLDNPWFGLGPGGYAFVYPHIGGVQFNIMATPLNIWLSFLTDVGIGGLLLLCWFLWSVLGRAYRFVRHDPLIAAYFWSVVSYLVLLTSSDNWFTEMFWFEIAMLLVAAIGPTVTQERRQTGHDLRLRTTGHV